MESSDAAAPVPKRLTAADDTTSYPKDVIGRVTLTENYVVALVMDGGTSKCDNDILYEPLITTICRDF